MKRLHGNLVGVDQGDPILFSDFETGGEMWTGRGQRERRMSIKFAEGYRTPPIVHVSMSMCDMDATTVMRAEVQAEAITKTGFDIVFRTWGDTRVARVRVNWLSFGELAATDDWDLY